MKFILNHTVFKYLISGGTAAFVDLLFLHLLDKYSGLHYLVSVNIAFIFAFFVSFSLQKYWTFDDKRNEEVKKQMIKYFVVSISNVFINSGLVHILLKYFITIEFFVLRPVVIAQIIASGIIAIESFFIYKYLIFKNKEKTLDHNKIIKSEAEVLL